MPGSRGPSSLRRHAPLHAVGWMPLPAPVGAPASGLAALGPGAWSDRVTEPCGDSCRHRPTEGGTVGTPEKGVAGEKGTGRPAPGHPSRPRASLTCCVTEPLAALGGGRCFLPDSLPQRPLRSPSQPWRHGCPCSSASRPGSPAPGASAVSSRCIPRGWHRPGASRVCAP